MLEGKSKIKVADLSDKQIDAIMAKKSAEAIKTLKGNLRGFAVFVVNKNGKCEASCHADLETSVDLLEMTNLYGQEVLKAAK